MHIQPVVQYASRTDVGMRRSANQDSLAVRLCNEFEEWQQRGHLFVVADGMGGHSVGDLASRITVETLPQSFAKIEADTVADRIRLAVTAANKAVNERGQQNPEFADMGTTCSALSLSEAGAVIGHIGDSRVYRVRRNVIAQLTFDHSLQWEMIRLGRATTANVDLFHPRNVITRCIGPDPHVKVDVEGPFPVEAGDRWILCSDGLSNHISDSELGQIAGSLAPVEAAQLLINLANCRGGSDNSTVIVVEVESYPIVDGATANPEAELSPFSDTREMDQQFAGGRAFGLLAAVVVIVAASVSFFAQSVAGKLAGGVLLVLLPVFWLIVRRFRRQAPAPDAGIPIPSPKTKTAPPDEFAAVSSDGINSCSPYRFAAASLTDSLLDDLAEIQSELIQAARDSGWTVNLERLTTLNRQSVAAQQTGKPDRALHFRGQAIDLLMKELYTQTRGPRT